MQMFFKEGLARIGKFSTPHGDIETPTVMPVINPNLNFLTEEELKSIGIQAVITNSYIIKRTASLEQEALKSGVHRLINFDGPIMTDSGTFQSYVYGDIEYDNREIVQFQKDIGSDIITILDIFTKPQDSYEQAKSAVQETYRRLKEVNTSDAIIAGPIQGSVYPDLRRESAKLMSEASYLPIGGVVPLLESYRYSDLVNIIINSKINSDFSKPIHLFGGGHPMFFAFSVLIGVDIFDSASYIKYAKDNRVLYTEGTRNLKEIRDFPEWSPLFNKYSPVELIKADEKTRLKLLSLHNLKAIFNEITEIKERIYENTLYQYVEEKSMAHPALYKAYMEMLSHNLDPFWNLSLKSPLYFFNSSTYKNTFIRRLVKFTEAYVRNGKRTILIGYRQWRHGFPVSEDILRTYETTDYNFLIEWNDIFIPMELENTYPVSQMVPSGIPDHNYRDEYIGWLKSINPEILVYDPSLGGDEKVRSYTHSKINEVYHFQFNSHNDLFLDSDKIIKSKATGHIRNIKRGDRIIATMRNDGFLTLSIYGGKLLNGMLDFPKSRVIVGGDSGEFNSQGFNVFFKFVEDCDRDIIAGNDVMVTDSSGNLYAVGHATVSGKEMKFYRNGIAVKVHEGIKKL
ncbi:tRNA guanosine(15) transglycosylase TgtA [Ferroplasma sp. Type II]|uniref:tRNA guanosine(15) transglycosylase TgtA n=1 Tax=Ferroplasma sp. Type II TaxID=261388 RepID=UPI0025C62A12|nr:tRNA guanosine(15) transglycosylase TgtA [Ferroplasma sp. Type II]